MPCPAQRHSNETRHILTHIEHIAGVPLLKNYQNAKKNLKRQKLAGVQLETTLELQQWASAHALPARLEDMAKWVTYAIPMDYMQYLNVDAVVLTLKVQVDWIGQLVAMPGRFVIHIDGKHKIHHGKWILVTIGTHSIESNRRSGIVHSFRPLVYMFCKQHESTDSIIFGLDALNMYATSNRKMTISNVRPSYRIISQGYLISGIS